jgi:trans-aconitate methyltransferase
MAQTSPSRIAGDLTTSRYWNAAWQETMPKRATFHWRRSHPLTLLLVQLLEQYRSEPVDILEIGCAPGNMLLELATHRPHDRYHGVDFSQPGLARAERLLGSRKVNATLHFADLRHFEPSQKYGLVYSCGLVEHFTDPADVLRHHVRFCAPGGIVAISMPNHRGRIQEWFIRQLDPAALRSHNLRIMDVAALHDLCEQAGLNDVVAGSGGYSSIRSRTVYRSIRAQCLRRIAQTWNLANRLCPKLSPRRNVIWAYGRAA